MPNEYDIRQLQKGNNLSAKEFSKYIEAIDLIKETLSNYFEGKFSKTTMPHRHILSDKKDTIILDVGALDGITSLDLIKKLFNLEKPNCY